jgi:hypothetical protein
MKATPSRKNPLILTPRDEEMLRAIYQFRYMTAKDMAYLLFTPRILNYVRHRLSRLAGDKDLATHTYLCRFQLPKVGVGRPEQIFTLGAKGRDFVEREAGLSVDWYFRPSKLKHLGFSHLVHALLLTRVVVAASYWSRQQSQYTLTHTRLSYSLARHHTLPVIPDAWLVLTDQQGKTYQILLEIDRGMEYQAKFKRHVKARLSFLESGVYTEVFGLRPVMVAYLTTGQRPEYRESRREAMTRWTQEVLQEMKMEDWAGIFRFTSVVFDDVYHQGIFEKAIWYRPDAPHPLPLLTP